MLIYIETNSSKSLNKNGTIKLNIDHWFNNDIIINVVD